MDKVLLSKFILVILTASAATVTSQVADTEEFSEEVAVTVQVPADTPVIVLPDIETIPDGLAVNVTPV